LLPVVDILAHRLLLKRIVRFEYTRDKERGRLHLQHYKYLIVVML